MSGRYSSFVWKELSTMQSKHQNLSIQNDFCQNQFTLTWFENTKESSMDS